MDVTADGAIHTQAASVVSRCPSKLLRYSRALLTPDLSDTGGDQGGILKGRGRWPCSAVSSCGTPCAADLRAELTAFALQGDERLMKF